MLQQSRQQAKRTLVHYIPVGLRKPRLKRNRKWVPQREIMAHIRNFHGFGVYTTSAFWQLYRRQLPTYPKESDASYCLTGPGARSGANWLLRHPHLMNKNSLSEHVGLFYVEQLKLIQHYVLQSPVLTTRRCDSAAVRDVKHRLRAHLCTLEGCAFMCCEYSKFVFWLQQEVR